MDTLEVKGTIILASKCARLTEAADRTSGFGRGKATLGRHNVEKCQREHEHTSERVANTHRSRLYTCLLKRQEKPECDEVPGRKTEIQ